MLEKQVFACDPKYEVQTVRQTLYTNLKKFSDIIINC